MLAGSVTEQLRLLYAALAMPGLEKIYDSREEAVDALIAEIQPETTILIIKARSIEEAIKESEVLSSATIILKTPLAAVKDEWVTAGQTILPCDLNTFWDPNLDAGQQVHRRQHRGT